MLVTEAAVRGEMMEHLPHIMMVCHELGLPTWSIVDDLLPIVLCTITDPDNQVLSSPLNTSAFCKSRHLKEANSSNLYPSHTDGSASKNLGCKKCHCTVTTPT